MVEVRNVVLVTVTKRINVKGEDFTSALLWELFGERRGYVKTTEEEELYSSSAA